MTTAALVGNIQLEAKRADGNPDTYTTRISCHCRPFAVSDCYIMLGPHTVIISVMAWTRENGVFL